MLWRNFCGFVALFVLANAQSHESLHRWVRSSPRDSGSKLRSDSDSFIDIDLENERNGDQTWQDAEELSGSGSGMDDTDDEDLLASGSGSGAGIIVPQFTDTPTTRIPFTSTPTQWPTTTTTTRVSTKGYPFFPPSTPRVLPLTPCQQLLEASQHLQGNYVPNCDSNGDYALLQCNGGQPQAGGCWCADLRGKKIPGTALDFQIPDCQEGRNLKLCVYQLVQQMRTTGLGVFRPQCTRDGDFEAVQCKGNMCYCVDPESGHKMGSTEVFKPDRPRCDDFESEERDDVEVERKITLFPPAERTTPEMEVEIKTQVNVNVEGEKPVDKDSEEDDVDKESNKSGGAREPMKKPSSAAASMMTQPGILAAIIGGSVVLLLCAVLLAMFIIYRMKKKDEGSYPLDEPKKLPYSYQRAPEKEFYA